MVGLAPLALLLLAGPALAAPAYQLDRRVSVLGEPIVLTLNARPGALDAIDLTPLTRDFEIQSRTLNRDGKQDHLALTLYPLRFGTLVPPPLGLPGRPPAPRVVEQSDAVPKVRFRVETEPAVLRARQPVRLIIEACDDGSLDWKRPDRPTRAGAHLRPLGEQQLETEREGEPCTAHRWHWALIATAAGTLDLAVPMLEAGKFGQRLRFPPPVTRLEARPVPAWKPVRSPPGCPWRRRLGSGGWAAAPARRAAAGHLAARPSPGLAHRGRGRL